MLKNFLAKISFSSFYFFKIRSSQKGSKDIRTPWISAPITSNALKEKYWTNVRVSRGKAGSIISLNLIQNKIHDSNFQLNETLFFSIEERSSLLVYLIKFTLLQRLCFFNLVIFWFISIKLNEIFYCWDIEDLLILYLKKDKIRSLI